jgi:hypothetical protein
MLTQHSGRKFLQLPCRHPAKRTKAKKPFVPQPAGSPAMAGIMNNKPQIAVSYDFGPVAAAGHGLDAMQGSIA